VKIEVFTDGSCWPNPGPEGGWGCVFLAGGAAVMMFGRIYGERVTNNIAELTAIIRALRTIPSAGHEVEVVSDSQWSIRSLDMTYNPKKNLDLIADGRNEMMRLGWSAKDEDSLLSFRHIRGHQGNLYNEMADKLAGEPWDNIPNVHLWDGKRLYVVACVEQDEVPAGATFPEQTVIAPRDWEVKLALLSEIPY